MDDATLARELRDLREQLHEGELDTADYARLRERLALRAAAEHTTPQSPAPRFAWRWGLAVIVAAAVVSAALLPAVRERTPGAGITGNDAIDANPTAAALNQWRAADRSWRAGRRSEAVRGYREAAIILPDRPELRTQLGLALAETGRLPEAVRELRMAVRTDPRLPSTRVYLGGVLLRAGRPDEAAAQWRRYLRLAPDGETATIVRRSLRNLRRSEGS